MNVNFSMQAGFRKKIRVLWRGMRNTRYLIPLFLLGGFENVRINFSKTTYTND